MLANLDLKAACGFFCAALVAAQALGHGGGGDIAIFETDGRVDIGFAVLDDDDITQVEFDANDNVFQAVFTPLPVAPLSYPWEYGADEPGFDANETELPNNALVEFNVISIRYWDGVGAVNFSPVSGIDGGYAPQSYNAESDGGFHEHPFFGFAPSAIGGQPVADGVYLTEMTISVEGLLDSGSFYLVGLVDEEINSIYESGLAGRAEADLTPMELANLLELVNGEAAALGEATQAYLDDPSAGAPTLGGVDFTYYAEAIQFAEAIPEPSSAVAALAAVLALAACRTS